MSIKRVLAVVNSPIIASCIVHELNTCGADVVIVGEQQKKEQNPFGNNESLIYRSRPSFDMPFIDTRNINKKIYTYISNKRKRKKK